MHRILTSTHKFTVKVYQTFDEFFIIFLLQFFFGFQFILFFSNFFCFFLNLECKLTFLSRFEKNLWNILNFFSRIKFQLKSVICDYLVSFLSQNSLNKNRQSEWQNWNSSCNGSRTTIEWFSRTQNETCLVNEITKASEQILQTNNWFCMY